MEAALGVAALKAGLTWGRTPIAPIESLSCLLTCNRRRMSVVYAEGDQQVAYVKGSPTDIPAVASRVLMPQGHAC
jgi:magnesium-transporting ATPase (P-type)